jgi:hypothetical protein
MAALDIDNLFQPDTPSQWLSFMLTAGATLGLSTTAWQSGDPARTILAIESVMLGQADTIASQMIQGRFLDYAATGTVTGTDLDGNTIEIPVSPDPSIPGQNDSAAPTWLDVLAQQEYDTTRLQSTNAGGPIAFVNTSITSQGTFAIGAFTIANVISQATYTNSGSFTLSTSTTKAISSVTAGFTTQFTVIGHGLSTGAVIFVSGMTGSGTIPNINSAQFNGSNLFYAVTVVDANTLSIGVVSSGSYTGGGSIYVAQSIEFAAPTLGPSSNAAPGYASVSVTSTVGCFFGNVASLSGAPWESNVALASRCRASTALASPNGVSQSYEYYCLAAYSLLQALTANPGPITLTGGPITQAETIINTSSGEATTILRNGGGIVDGCLNVAITNVSATSPIQITTFAPHNCISGEYGQANGVGGNTQANGQWQITVISPTVISLDASTYGGTPYTSGGSFSGGDLYAIDLIVQAYTVPEAVTATEQSALAVAAVITGTVYVPIALVATYQASMQTTMTTYFAGFPIGGLNVDSGTNLLPYGDVVGLLFSSGNQNGAIYTKSVFNVLINGSAADLSLTSVGFPVPNLTGIVVIGV